jgi:two-component system chemotaxis response regulator CheB
MPEILSRAGPLPAHHAEEHEPIRCGHVYLAPPDHHLLVARGHLHIVQGPKENGFRPAVDALFRSAALAYGPRTVGVVLTGMLDDGTAGLLAVKRQGGVAIVQDPADALFPDMPSSALRYVDVDAVKSLEDIPPLLVRLAHESVIEEEILAMPEDIEREAEISKMDQDALEHASSFGAPVPYSCPDCGGVLMEYYDHDLLRFRCQVGHAYSRDSMVAMETKALDRSLWMAYRALEERAALGRRLAADAERLHDAGGVRRFRALAEQAAQQKLVIQQALGQQSVVAD